MDRIFTVGEIARRTGLAPSAIRFYEEKGLVKPLRSPTGQRRFRSGDLRRISFILAAQKLGFSLGQIVDLLKSLPSERTPTKSDWTRISKAFRRDLDARITALENLRDRLDGCIGCGCLSLKACKLYNPDDQLGKDGDGPRLI